MRLALYQPEIPQNTGTLLRTAACLGFGVDIILPCGFPFSDRQLKRAGMDYMQHVDVAVHDSYLDFCNTLGQKRLVLLSTKASMPYTEFSFMTDDVVMVGRESSGVESDIEDSIRSRILIPMNGSMRSLNVAIAASIVMAHGLHQTQGWHL